ncbi:hypothetical protein ACTWQF_27625 [Streptomyces sp. 8N114]|uniref:hypothetical protein n=1 Tax=Streptomyces sp. 8N114 TaxID=3457419 RepID=UPI003FCFE180
MTFRAFLSQRPERCAAAAGAAVVMAVTAVSSLLSSAPAPAAATQQQRGTTYYLDCQAGKDTAAGTTPASAWRSLRRAGARTYAPGDRLLIKRGTRCVGVLKPRGKGAEGRPVLIGAYGKGAKPRLEGRGARATVHLVNTAHWEVRNLDISNSGRPPKSKKDLRSGVLVQLRDYGTARHFVVDGVDVHDVNGAFAKEPDPSGGIIFVVHGTRKPTRFDGIRIENSTVRHVDRTGIGTASTWSRREENMKNAKQAGRWEPITGLKIRRNKLYDVGGDGIVVQNARGGLVERNYLNGFNKRGRTYNAGIWGWNADEVLYQYNEVTGGHGNKDSMAFDFDGANNRNVYRYNYSHDNEGGFLLICEVTDTITRNNRFHDNISINDRNLRSGYGVVSVLCGPSEDNSIYRNTIVTKHGRTPMVTNDGKDTDDAGIATFQNNIFLGSLDRNPVKDRFSLFKNNLYWNISERPRDPQVVIADPKLHSGAPKVPDDVRLRPGSPALGAGAVIKNDDATHDYFGNALTTPPNLGADQGKPAR